jgi:hypothetical protein
MRQAEEVQDDDVLALFIGLASALTRPPRTYTTQQHVADARFETVTENARGARGPRLARATAEDSAG